MKTINYSQALKILGLKGRPSDQEIRKAYLKLAKKWHPDVNSSVDATEQFKRISLANIVLKNGPGSPSLSFSSFKPEYQELKRMLVGDFDYDRLNEAEVALIQKYRDVEGKQKKIELAKELVANEYRAREFIRDRARSRIVKTARSKLASPEEQQQAKVQKMMAEMQYQQDVAMLKSAVHRKLKKVADAVVVRNGRARIPILSKVNGRSVVKLVLASAGLVGLIIAGKYVYDAQEGAFKPVKLLGGVKK
jgi:hypothetical protein